MTSVLDQYGLVQYCAKVIQTKIVEFRYLFFRNFIELSCESSWKFSPALRVISLEQRAIFLRKFAIKSLWKTKQFSARHARSLCRVLSTKNGFKGSCELRSSCFDKSYDGIDEIIFFLPKEGEFEKMFGKHVWQKCPTN